MRFLKLLSLLAILSLFMSCSDGDSNVANYAGGGASGPPAPALPAQQASLRLGLDFNAVANKVRLKLPTQATNARVEIYDTETGRLSHQETVEREAGAASQEVLIEGLTVGVKLVRTILLDSEGNVLGYSDQIVNATAGAVVRVTVSTMIAGSPPPPSFEPVVPGKAVRLVFVVHPESHTSGQTFTVEVVALDGNGQRVTNFRGPVTLQGAGLAPITVPMVDGIAVFNGLILDNAGDGVVFSASSDGLKPASSLPFQVLAAVQPSAPVAPPGPAEPEGPGPSLPTPTASPTPEAPIPPAPVRVATSLRFVSVPDVTQTAGTDFEVQVEVRDQFGSRFSSGTQALTLSLEESPDAAVLGGQATATAVAGLATFNVDLSKLGSYKLTVAATGLVGATSTTLQVQAAAASGLAFFVEPADGTAGMNLVPAPGVEVQDVYGNRVVSDPGLSITLALATKPVSAQLGGTLSQTTAAADGTDPGLATFDNLRPDRAGSYSFTASAAGLTSATSRTFIVAAATPNQLVFVQSPPTSMTAGVTAASSTVLEMRDASGQRVYDFSDSITLSIQNYTPGQGAASGSPMLGASTATLTVAASQGRASFANLQPNLTGSYTIQASAAGTSSLPTSSFGVVHGAPTSLAYTSSNPQSSTSYGATLSDVGVVVLDALGNRTTSSTGTVALSVTGGGGALSGSLTRTLANALANFSDLTVGPGPGPASAKYKLRASSGSLSLLGAEFLVEQPSEFHVNSGNLEFLSQTVAIDAAGNFVVTFVKPGQGNIQDIYAQRYNAQGIALGAEFRVNTYVTSYQGYSSVAMAGNGNFVIVWVSADQDGSGNGVYAQRFDAEGLAQGNEFRVNSWTANAQENPAVAMDSDGDFVIAWESNGQDSSSGGIYAQRFDAKGEAEGNEFQVNSYTHLGQYAPSVAMNSDGEFVIAWSSSTQDRSGSGVYAQRYDAEGTGMGEFQVNTHTDDSQYQPSVAMDSDGDFVVVWASFQQRDSTGSDIYGQRFNAAGVPQGGEFLINTDDSSDYVTPSLAVDGDGNFLVVWASWYQDGSGLGVYARRFNAQGVPQTGEFRVNTYTEFYQRFPTAAMNGRGDAVVVWDGPGYGSTGADDTEGAHGQRYPAVTTP